MKKENVNKRSQADIDEEREIMKAWEQGLPIDVTVSKNATSVLSVRIPRELHDMLSIAAKKEGVKATTYIRHAIEEKLSSTPEASNALLSNVFTRLASVIFDEKDQSTSDQHPRSA